MLSYAELEKAFFDATQVCAALQENGVVLSEKIGSLEKRVAQYQQAYESLMHQIREANRNRFGSRSERDADPRQMSLFELFPEWDLPKSKPAEEETVTVPEHTRKKKADKKDWRSLPREIEIIPVSDEERQCACGHEKQTLRYETKTLLDYQPATLRVIEERREIVACNHGCDGSVCIAPVKPRILPKVGATENLLATVVVSKLHDRQPLYHLEKHHLIVSRETMARWIIKLTDPLQPMLNLIKDRVIDYDVASYDATTLQVLDEPDRRAQTKSYAYSMRGGPPDQRVVLYHYAYENHKVSVDDWFEGFRGYVHMDASQVADGLLQDPNVYAVLCNAHARRKFEAVKKQAKTQGLAHEALRFYKKLYAIERRAKENKLTPEQRYVLRQSESKPILEEFKVWMDASYPTTMPLSPLGQAFAYCLKGNRWQGLTRFMEDGRLEIDNNLQEQEIKPLVIARKNFMFCQSMNGARALCLHMSLIRTALLHGLNPHQYYVALLKRIPYCSMLEDYEQLLPWNIFKDLAK